MQIIIDACSTLQNIYFYLINNKIRFVSYVKSSTDLKNYKEKTLYQSKSINFYSLEQCQ